MGQQVESYDLKLNIFISRTGKIAVYLCEIMVVNRRVVTIFNILNKIDITILISRYMQIVLSYLLSVVSCFTELVSITALYFAEHTSHLIVGLNFGSFQFWQLGGHKLE